MTDGSKLLRWLVPGVAMGGALLLTAPAYAQIGPTSRLTRPQVLQDGTKTNKAAPPPALPGSKPAEDAVVPSDRVATDMSPNDALFDSINRGDLGGAKDALNRGADLEARNVLGQTPIDVSIDTGRNDISFLLLSMRGSGGSHRGPPAAAVAQAPVRPPGRSARTAREAAVAPERVKPVPTQAPQLFAGNGGAPVPQSGFLGFSNGRSP